MTAREKPDSVQDNIVIVRHNFRSLENSDYFHYLPLMFPRQLINFIPLPKPAVRMKNTDDVFWPNPVISCFSIKP